MAILATIASSRARRAALATEAGRAWSGRRGARLPAAPRKGARASCGCRSTACSRLGCAGRGRRALTVHACARRGTRTVARPRRRGDSTARRRGRDGRAIPADVRARRPRLPPLGFGTEQGGPRLSRLPSRRLPPEACRVLQGTHLGQGQVWSALAVGGTLALPADELHCNHVICVQDHAQHPHDTNPTPAETTPGAAPAGCRKPAQLPC